MIDEVKVIWFSGAMTKISGHHCYCSECTFNVIGIWFVFFRSFLVEMKLWAVLSVWWASFEAWCSSGRVISIWVPCVHLSRDCHYCSLRMWSLVSVPLHCHVTFLSVWMLVVGILTPLSWCFFFIVDDDPFAGDVLLPRFLAPSRRRSPPSPLLGVLPRSMLVYAFVPWFGMCAWEIDAVSGVRIGGGWG